MQKIINFRAFLLIFIGAIIGVIFSINLLQKNLGYFIVSIVLECILKIVIVLNVLFAQFGFLVDWVKEFKIYATYLGLGCE